MSSDLNLNPLDIIHTYFDLKTSEDIWYYLIKKTAKLEETQMKAILEQEPKFKKPLEELIHIFEDEKFWIANEDFWMPNEIGTVA